MTNISETAEECNHVPPAKDKKAASAASASRGVSNGGGEKTTKTPVFFSWDLAIKINPEQPDILASLLIYGLYTWKPKSNGGSRKSQADILGQADREH